VWYLEPVWIIWLTVFFVFNQSVHSRLCSTASWSAEYVDGRWQFLHINSSDKERKEWFSATWLPFQRQSSIDGV